MDVTIVSPETKVWEGDAAGMLRPRFPDAVDLLEDAAD